MVGPHPYGESTAAVRENEQEQINYQPNEPLPPRDPTGTAMPGPDDVGGVGGPRARAYLPAPDDSTGGVGPRSRDLMPGPEDDGSGSGPRSTDVFPNPEDSGGGGPRGFALRARGFTWR